VDEQAGVLRCRGLWRDPSCKAERFEAVTRSRTFTAGIGLPGRVWSTGRPAWIADVTVDANFPRGPIAAEEGLHGAFAAPITLGGTVLGVVEFFSPEVREPDPDLLEMMATLGVQVGQFLEREQAGDRLRQQTRVAETLNRIGVRLAAELDLQRLVQLVTDESTRLLDARLGAFFYNVTDERGESYTLFTISGVPREAFAGLPMPRSTELFGPTYRGERIVRLDDVTLDPRFGKNAPYHGLPPGHLPVRSYLAVPVVSRTGAVLGGLFFGHPEPGRFGEEDERLVAGLAAQAAVAIDNARLYQELQEADRRKGELLASLRDSEERFRTMAESIPQLAWMARPDGTIYWYNRRWHEYTGTTPEQMKGWGWQSVHDPEILPKVLERWRHTLATGEPFDMVFPLRGADGRFRPFLTRVMPVRDETGRIVHWFGTNTDITDRLRIEEELRAAKEEAEAANQAKTQFLAVLSHELRTPLNPILLATSAMLERPPDPAELRPTLEMIRQNVLIQARLIDDLLDVMRIVRGKMPLHWEVADCHRLLTQAVQICRSELHGHEVHPALELRAQHHHVNADPARLQQVFWNLIKNAVKFTPDGGSITIRTVNPENNRDRLVVEVIDTGIGIDPKDLPRVFDPFHQGEATAARKFGGLGLGLAICKGIVEAHGGTISAESLGKGCGTTFRVELRALPEPADEANGPPASGAEFEPVTASSSLKILIVEDEPTTLRLMARLLRGLGHSVTTAGTIASALEGFESDRFDLIISDIGLPDGSGLELMRRVVATRGSVASIALTGYGMEEDIRRSREAGFTAHLTKPIDFVKLEAMIRQVTPVHR
jgi:PAS domain S-box-containing protein